MNRTHLPLVVAASTALALALALAPDVVAQKKTVKTPGTPTTATELFDAFRSVPGVRANYREAKKLSVLDDELVSEGVILFAPPTQLIRVTTKPLWSSLVVKEKTLIMRDASGTQKLPAAKGSKARAFIQVFVDVARGDQKALETYFRIAFSTKNDAWTVVLTPKDAKKLPIKNITLTGVGTDLKTMTLLDGLGDRTQMSFTRVDVSRRPSRKDIAALLTKP